jgi:HD-GYP domain-containing protein (c-di-GMP phosphodiesterase class II)
MNIGGLIAAAVGGAAEGYGKGAEMEMKKQGELDLRKQLLEAESEKRLREDETKRERDRTEETRKMSPEYIAQTVAADLAKTKGGLENRKTVAPQAAEVATSEYTANKPLDITKAADAVTAKIAETTSLSGSADYLKGEAKLNEAKGAAGIKAAQIRADSIKDRPTSGGGSGVKVRSTYTDDQGQKVAVLSDGSTKVLGKAADYDKTLSNLVTKMAKDDYKFAKLPENEKRKKAEERLRGQIVVPSSGRDLSKYERDATAD